METTHRSEFTDLNITNQGTNANVTFVTSGPLFDLKEQTELDIFLYPLILIIIYMCVGLIGNSIVIYIFIFQWKRTKTSVFILTLAIFDIVNCSINMSIEISILRNPLSFDFDVLCKVSRFTSYVTTASYSFVLVVIACDRYLMVCRPFKSMTLGIPYARRTCIGAVLLAVATQWPSLFFYGTHNKVMKTDIPNTYVLGKTCLVTNYYMENKAYTYIAFNTFLFICHVLMFFLFISVYIVIGRRLFMASRSPIVGHPKRQQPRMLRVSILSAITGVIPRASLCSRGSKTMSSDNISPSTAPAVYKDYRTTIDQMNIDQSINRRACRIDTLANSKSKTRSLNDVRLETGEPLAKKEKNKSKKLDLGLVKLDFKRKYDRVYASSHNIGAISSVSPVSLTSSDSAIPLMCRHQSDAPNYTFGVTPNGGRSSPDIKELSLKQNTLIMRMVTITYVLSYLPFLVIASLRFSYPDIPEQLDSNYKIVYHVFLRSYFINSVIRPFIYIVMDMTYRKCVLDLISLKKCRK